MKDELDVQTGQKLLNRLFSCPFPKLVTFLELRHLLSPWFEVNISRLWFAHFFGC